MGARPAVGIIHRRELAAADDPVAVRDRLAEQYEHTQLRPHVAATSGHIDELIEPWETRSRLAWAFRSLQESG
jgi:propionyl-CoA carboxylase beta chain